MSGILKIVKVLKLWIQREIADIVVGHVPCISDCLMSFSILEIIIHHVLQPHDHQQRKSCYYVKVDVIM